MKTNSIAVLLSLVLAANTVHSTTITWTNTAGGNWSVAANWSPNQVPGTGNIAVLPDVGDSYAVNLDSPALVSGLVVGATSGANTQTFNNPSQTLTVNGVIQINSQGAFNVEGGEIAGTNALSGTLNWTGGTLTGVMTVSNNGVLNIATFGNTIGFQHLTLTNYGTVNWTNTTINSGLGTQIYNYGLWNAQSDDGFVGGA
ncbi:MAG TPA: hypothetical protein VH595_13500, partial [Verrucomicrobiae bacterium]|nr:hypothetical protein [Verrucomicrobiae bacterium]